MANTAKNAIQRNAGHISAEERNPIRRGWAAAHSGNRVVTPEMTRGT